MPNLRHAAPWQPLLLSLAICAATPSYAASNAAASPLEQPVNVQIAAQPLAQALLSLAEQANLRLSFDSQAIAHSQSAALTGSMSPRQALDRLLNGSNMEWRLQDDGSILLLPLPSQTEGAHVLPNTLINAEQLPQGTTYYDSEDLQSMPVRQGKLTELLRQNPAVNFDKSSLSSKTPGNLAAENISINGAKFWDNNFSIDGMSMNNDLNPGGRSIDANSSFTDLPANTSQGLNIDLSLLESVEVYDSNVSAEYGGFTGGVVNATTRKPKQEFSGSVSAAMTKDSWTQYYIDDRYKDEFYDNGDADGNADTQPKFKTLTYRATLEGYLTDNFGLLGSVVRRESTVYDQNIYATYMADNGVTAPTTTNLGQTVDNLFLKGVWQVNDRLNLTGSVNYAPEKSEHFNINTLDGSFEMESGGLQTFLQAEWQGDWGVWTHDLAWSELQQSRLNGADYFKAWYYSADKNWADPTQMWNAAMEGTYGNIEQTQERLSYHVKLDLNPFVIASSEHNIKLGAGFDNTQASYGRDNEMVQANGTDLIATNTCTASDGSIDTAYCSASPVLAQPWTPWPSGQGQMFKRLYYYKAGDINVEQQAWAAFAQDTVQWRNFNLRAGLRAEQNDFNNNLNLAPRLMLTWDLFANKQTQLIAGANRYYGREIFDLRLREERDALREVALRDSNTLLFGPRTQAGLNTTDLASLKTPYDDELSLGIEQIAFDTLFSLRFVKRNGENQLHRIPLTNNGNQPNLATTYYQYNNDGSTDSKHIYLTMTPLHDLQLWGSKTRGSLSFGWSDIESSSRSYDDNFDDTLVMYKGSPIKTYEIPVDNYARPWTGKLVTQTHIPALNLTLGNFFNYRAGYSQVIRNGRTPYQGQNIYNYVDKELGSALTWDARVGWELPTGASEAMFVNLDVGNVLNRRNTIGSVSSTSLNAEVDYEMGRNYTLEVGYRF